MRVVTLGHNGGKGTAVAAGVRHALTEHPAGGDPRARLRRPARSGSHPRVRGGRAAPTSSSAGAATGAAMPLAATGRPTAPRASPSSLSARSWVPDTQNGMRLFRTEALAKSSRPGGLRGREPSPPRAARERARGHPVEIPTVYDGEPSHFRPVRDTVAVASAARTDCPTAGRAPSRRRSPLRCCARGGRGSRRRWAPCSRSPPPCPRFNRSTISSSSPSTGSATGRSGSIEAFDPHTRNYILLLVVTLLGAAAVARRVRYVVGAGLAVLLAGYLAGAALEVLKLFVERARPEEVLGTQVLLSHERSWSHLASFPSGHLIVTAAMAAAAATAVPVLRATADRLCRRDRVHARPVRGALPPRRDRRCRPRVRAGPVQRKPDGQRAAAPQRWTTVPPLPEPARLHEARR